MGKRNRNRKNRINQAVKEQPEVIAEAAPEKSEYELLLAERDELTLKYNANTNFIQKNQIYLQKQRVLKKISEIEVDNGNKERSNQATLQ